ncbi:Na(+)/H(+) antiporter subunit B [Oceanidesulfovibrio marinus]|uniref:MrpA C-terminal/MbhD domain-containing protein n=1 Tax=Oceanidesulfovibrio marinus TaxID=370038 RepID=A0A6P1Z9Z4_9BACT|nr:hydrogenase subunit MbhD domain-containing protein [Oceanidesulfovibrio marinus]TVM27282.1 hypothetical protein DQK91_22685 [Oceanidesulfovibrio marinus]
MMDVRMLLKSWAMPPANAPMASIFCDCSSCFGIYSFLMCVLWAVMGAVDVSFTEASVGAGVSTVLFIAAVFRTTRRTKD